MTIPVEIQDAQTDAVERERRRIVGLVLATYARYRLAGEREIADVLDRLATEIEHSEH